MNDSLYRISLDIHSTQSQVSIPVTQFDTAKGLLVTLTEGGKPYMLSDDCRAAFTGTKADGNTLYNDCIILNSSVIRYDFTEQTTAAIGIVDAAIKVFGANDKVITSPRLTLLVYEDTVGFVTPSTTELGIIDRIVQNDATQDANIASMSETLTKAQKDITIANSKITLANSNIDKNKNDIITVNRNLSIAQIGIDNAKTDIVQAQSDIAQAQSDIVQAQNDIDQVKSDLEKMADASGDDIPKTIDLSRLDDGEIVETFSDGSTKTTTIEYDADGNPVKITDGDGNVTDLTW